MDCQNIDEVILAFNQIVKNCKATDSRLGYFAVLYRRVTLRVKTGVLAGEFENGQRMERLVVLFANRYLEAFEQNRQQTPPTASWKIAFESARSGDQIVMQHLLLGINAHINLDLGIAAVAAARPEKLENIRRDFDDINRVLSELVAEVKLKIGKISPAFGLLMPLAGKMDEKLIRFSIQTARDGAWKFAGTLDPQADNAVLIAERDQKVHGLGHLLAHPNWRLRWILKMIGWSEWRSVAAKLQILEANI